MNTKDSGSLFYLTTEMSVHFFVLIFSSTWFDKVPGYIGLFYASVYWFGLVFFKIGFLCAALALLELTLWTR